MGAVVTASGVVVPVKEDKGDGTYLVETPCGAEATTTGRPLRSAHVVLDPGHGGINEPGAVGPGGLIERDVNLAVALEAARLLAERGATVVLTRTTDHMMTIAARAAIAVALDPLAFVSIHHNADPDGPSEVPGSETYYQIADDDSKRLAGLLWQEVSVTFAGYDVEWVADTDHGAKYRPGENGDYYGILRRSAGVPTVLSEAAFISNPPEERLLSDPAVQRAEAAAIADGLTRFITTDDPGTGYVEPYPRIEPAGGGGGSAGCVEPPLG